jgi:hypothetical protein
MEAPVFVESLSLWSLSFVKIDDSPLLVLSSVVAPNSYLLAFNVFSSSYIKYFTVLPIDELIFLILEYLEPSRVGAPDLHVVGSTSTLDIPRLVVISGSDSQGLLMEVPDLSLSTIWCLDNKVSVVDQVKVSVVWKCRDDVEISLNVKSELLVELTLSWLIFILININYLPSLMDLSVLLLHDNVSVFIIKPS